MTEQVNGCMELGLRQSMKHNHMQGLLWHCNDWKDVLFFQGAFGNAVYKPGVVLDVD